MGKSLDSISKTPIQPAGTTTPPVVETVKKPENPKQAAPASTSAATPTTATPTVEDNSYASLFPEPTIVISGPPTWIWWILLVIGSLGLGFLGYTVASGKASSALSPAASTLTPSPTTAPTATATPIATATPTPSPSPTASATPTPTTTATDISKITLRVLNGTTKTGAAGAASATLKSAGFTVRTVGNANSQTYTSTYIYYQTGQETAAKLVQKALPNYSITLQESTLANPDAVLVVIGTK